VESLRLSKGAPKHYLIFKRLGQELEIANGCLQDYVGPLMGRHFLCSEECSRKHKKNRELTDTFGISLLEYEKLLKMQEGKCAICDGIPQENSNMLAVDHCHLTGKIRGLLCMRCNRAIGLFRDDPQLLRRSLEYLENT
jgi:hypothetical protein